MKDQFVFPKLYICPQRLRTWVPLFCFCRRMFYYQPNMVIFFCNSLLNKLISKTSAMYVLPGIFTYLDLDYGWTTTLNETSKLSHYCVCYKLWANRTSIVWIAFSHPSHNSKLNFWAMWYAMACTIWWTFQSAFS